MINWRDASKELPENLADCIVITRSFSQDGKIITNTQNSYYYRRSDKWGHVNGCHVLAWVYTHELIQLCGLNQYLIEVRNEKTAKNN